MAALPSPQCNSVKYLNWNDVKSSDLGLWTQLEFTPSFISRMRPSLPFLPGHLGCLCPAFAAQDCRRHCNEKEEIESKLKNDQKFRKAVVISLSGNSAIPNGVGTILKRRL
ncbi:Hypothetical predicted protein [Cloeon dipterum]|uniref:Uncharacterized protein n=1 Tax=Cloeon dipterum TaxID=197152 RepID=A0A8S1DVN2_9INSE|nr:Hypothetical predicted protein [Cloeon dipterum]